MTQAQTPANIEVRDYPHVQRVGQEHGYGAKIHQLDDDQTRYVYAHDADAPPERGYVGGLEDHVAFIEVGRTQPERWEDTPRIRVLGEVAGKTVYSKDVRAVFWSGMRRPLSWIAVDWAKHRAEKKLKEELEVQGLI